jgi:hypothetical protein
MPPCVKDTHVLAGDAGGEITFPIAGEIQIDAPSSLAHAQHLSLDELISLREAIETVDIVSALDAIGW